MVLVSVSHCVDCSLLQRLVDTPEYTNLNLDLLLFSPIFHVELHSVQKLLVIASIEIESRDDVSDGSNDSSEDENTDESVQHFQKILG